MLRDRVRIWKDYSESGSDQLKIFRIRTHVKELCPTIYLYLFEYGVLDLGLSLDPDPALKTEYHTDPGPGF